MTAASAIQRSIWDELNRASAPQPSNHAVLFHLDQGVDILALSEALRRLVWSTPALRTRFYWKDGALFQEILNSQYLDFRVETVAEPESAEAILNEEQSAPFDHLKSLPHRFVFVKSGEDDHSLIAIFSRIVADSASVSLAARGLAAFHEDVRANRGPKVAVDGRFHALCEEESRHRDSSFAREMRRFWDGQYGEDLEDLEFPTDLKPRGNTSRRMECDPDGGILDAALPLARKLGVAAETMALAAFCFALHKLGAKHGAEILVAGRSAAFGDAESVFGPLEGLLPVSVRFSRNDTLRNLIRLLQSKLTASKSAAYWEAISASREGRQKPRAEIGFSYDTIPVEEPSALGTPRFERAKSAFPLHLGITESGGRVSAILEFHPEYISDSTAKDLGLVFAEALGQMESFLDQPFGGIPLPKPVFQRTSDPEMNDTDKQYPFQGWIPERISRQALLNPGAVALRFEGESMTYGELQTRVNRMANLLNLKGVRPGSFVGVSMDRSLEMMVGILAILNHGSAYVPIDPKAPGQRKADMAESAGLAAIVIDGRNPGLPFLSVPLSLDVRESDNKYLSDACENAGIKPMDPAYVIFTSGTTGKPKGVAVPHLAILNRLDWMQERYSLSPGDYVCQKTPITFDVSVWELFWALMNGSTLVIARPEGHKDPAYITDLIEKEKITTLHFVPSMLKAFLESVRPNPDSPLRQVFASGEALGRDVMDSFQVKFPGARLHNLYGPTEAAVDVTFWECDPAYIRKIVPIGRPIANVKTFILDENLDPVPAGVAGELVLAGACLALGYVNEPGLTASKFVANPLGTEEGERIYRTGDLCRYLPEGEIEYLGRLDEQVKIRGFRIEPGEIEAALNGIPGVKESVVLATDIEGLGKVLVAYVVTQGGMPTDSAFKERLKDSIPEYMVPSFFVEIPGIPLSAHGKVDRKKLPRIGEGSPKSPALAAPKATLTASNGVARGKTEEALFSIWSMILGRSDFGTADDFFTLGGHSILLIKMQSRIKEILGVEAPLQMLFENPTIHSLASRLDQDGRKEEAPPVSVQPQDGTPGMFPLSSTQAGMWFEQRLRPESNDFNMNCVLMLDGRLEMKALEETLEALILRHRQMRATFHLSSDGNVYYRINPISSPVLAVSESGGEEALEYLAARMGRKAYRLDAGPLFDLNLVPLERGRHGLVITVHHIIFDGYSVKVVLEEFAAVYGAKVAGRNPDLPPLNIQYEDFVIRERREATHKQATLQYWKRQLAGAPGPIPSLPARPVKAGSGEGAMLDYMLDNETRMAIENWSREGRTTPFTLFLTAFYLALYRSSGQSDLVVGIPFANRPERGMEGLVGLFLNTLPFRISIFPDETYSRLIGRVREMAMNALANSDISFAALKDISGPGGPRDRSLFQTALSFIDDDWDVPRIGELQAKLDWKSRSSKFDLALYVTKAGNGYRCVFEYRSDRFDPQWMADFSGHFREFLTACILDPDLTVTRMISRAGMNRDEAGIPTGPAIPVMSASPAGASGRPRVPVSRMQTRFWVMERMHGKGMANLVPLIMRMDNSLDPAELSAALKILLERHAILGTRYLEEGGSILGQPGYYSIVDILSSRETAEGNWEEEARAFVWDPNYVSAPPFRSRLLSLPPGAGFVLVLVFDHMAIDLPSLEIFVEELLRILDKKPLPAPSRPFSEYARWESLNLGTGEGDPGFRFWREKLARMASPYVLPYDNPASAQGWKSAGYQEAALDGRTYVRIKETVRERHATPFAFFSAMFAVFLNKYTGATQVSIPFPILSRKDSAFNRTIGPFLNTAFLSAEIEDATTFPELVARMMNDYVDCLDHGETPIDVVIHSLPAVRQRFISDLFSQILFNYIVRTKRSGMDVPHRCRFIDIKAKSTKYDLKLSIEDDGSGISLSLQHSERFNAETAGQMMRDILQLIEAFAEDPNTAPGAIRFSDSSHADMPVAALPRT